MRFTLPREGSEAQQKKKISGTRLQAQRPDMVLVAVTPEKLDLTGLQCLASKVILNSAWEDKS